MKSGGYVIASRPSKRGLIQWHEPRVRPRSDSAPKHAARLAILTPRDQGAASEVIVTKPESKLVLIFVVNGRDVVLDDVNPSSPLHAARNMAIAKSNATGRPPDDWEIRDEADQVLDPNRKISSFDFKSGAKLFLSVRVGGGGCA